ncbi:MucBP domain-containing protein [Lactococcus lactis]|uniref:MucBP domain-containing protein n=1 Tax=Lactococcus lactis TaxID=1358 RepID=UPI003F876ABF
MCGAIILSTSVPVSRVFAEDKTPGIILDKNVSDDIKNNISQSDNIQSLTNNESTRLNTTANSKSSESLETTNNIVTSTWGTSTVNFDIDTGTLTVFAGTMGVYDVRNQYLSTDNKINKASVKKIIFKDGVKAPANSRMLFSVNNFKSLIEFEGTFDTSDVTTMLSMFEQCKAPYLDVSNWDTSNVVNMNGVFSSTQFTSLDVKNWNTANVTDMSFMFYKSKLTSLDAGSWNTTNLLNMHEIFEQSQLTSINLTSWDTSKVYDMDYMFFLTKIEQLQLGEKIKFKNTNVKLTKIDTSSGIYTGKWERVEPSSPASVYNSSDIFMTNYDGSLPGTYVWQKVKASDVTVKYVDSEGNKISDDAVKSGNVGDTYTTEQKTIDGYTFKEVQGSTTGTFTDQAQTVTYIYTKDPVVGGDVTVKYVDSEGNKISDDAVKSGNVGDTYTTEQKTIDGYTFKEVQGSTTGTLTDQAQTVTYIYTKDPVVGGDVTVKYVDSEGNKISDDAVKSGNVGDTYTTEQKTIDGYTFKEVQGSTTGTFTDQAQTVTYIYTKDPVVGGDVTVKYVDSEGNKISDDAVKSGNVGDTYTTEQKTIDGYTFKEVQGSTTGTLTDQAQTVTYIYTKDPVVGGDVTVKYVDSEGNKISDDAVKSGNVGDTYTTEQKTIDGYTFKEVQGSTTGTLTDQSQTVTYVYTKKNKTVNHATSPSSKNLDSKIKKNTVSKKLPETGEKQGISMFMFIFGFSLLSISIVLGLSKKIKR